jgi:hypothetical protein
VAKGLPHQRHHESQKEIKLKIWKWFFDQVDVQLNEELTIMHSFYKLHIINQISVWLWSLDCDTIAILKAQATSIITTEGKRLKIQSYYTPQVASKMVAQTHRWERRQILVCTDRRGDREL